MSANLAILTAWPLVRMTEALFERIERILQSHLGAPYNVIFGLRGFPQGVGRGGDMEGLDGLQGWLASREVPIRRPCSSRHRRFGSFPRDELREAPEPALGNVYRSWKSRIAGQSALDPHGADIAIALAHLCRGDQNVFFGLHCRGPFVRFR
jgi:hypothetical protein